MQREGGVLVWAYVWMRCRSVRGSGGAWVRKGVVVWVWRKTSSIKILILGGK